MGQLTNQYVSQSYQGLLNLNNANTGLTANLQTVTDGLGGSSPLQISQTQINISGTFTVNGAPVGGTDTGSLMKTGSVAGNVLTFTKGDGSTFNLSVDTGSVPSGTISGSQQIIDLGFLQTSSFNSYTSSNDSKVNSLIASTGSYATTSSLTSLSQSIATTDLGQDNRLGSLESATGSLQNQINQKLDSSSFNSYTSSNDTKVNDLISKTGSYATTGSNNFVGQQNINGSVNVTGSLNVTGEITALSASITYLETIYQTSSVIFSSGSNILGDEAGDTQTLYGTVKLPNGPLSVTGSATISNTLNVQTALTASGLNYPTADGVGDMFLSTDGGGNLTFDWVKTLHQNIRNSDSVTISRGTPLFVSGATGDNVNVYVADANNPSRRPATLIAFDSTLAPSATGTAIISGEIQGVDTTGYPAGSVIYLASGGGWTSTRPTGSASVQVLGVVTREANNGRGIVFNQVADGLPNLVTDKLWIGDSNFYPVEKTVGEIGLTTTSSFNAYTSSTDGRLNSIETETGSLQNQINQKLDTGSFNTYTASMDARTGSYITTGSAVSSQSITGSLILSGSAGVELDVKGDQTNTGSLTVRSGSISSISNNTTLNIDSYLTNSLGGQANIIRGWSDNPAGGGAGAVQSNYTGSLRITGSNNIVTLPQIRATGVGGGTDMQGYISGSGNILSTNLSTIYLNTGSLLFPKTNNNNLGSAANIYMRFTTSSLAGGHPLIQNNTINGGNIDIVSDSGSINVNNNTINGGGITTTQNFVTNARATVSVNTLNAGTVTLNHISSSINYTNNISNSPITINNHLSSSIVLNTLTFTNNTVFGGSSNTGVGVWVSGSQASNTTRTISDNLIGGRSSIVSSSFVGSNNSNLISSLIYGQNLIVSGNHASTGGSTFVGRFNDTGSLNRAQDIVFAVGTGTAAATRRTGLYVTSGSLVGVSGSLDVKGNSIVTGSVTATDGFSGSLQGTASFATNALSASFAPSDRNGLITTGSLVDTQTILGTLRISGSSPLQVGTENNVGKINTYGGSNWLYRNSSNYNTVIGNVAGVDNGFFGSSEKNMILNGFFTPFSTGSNNVIIQGAGDDFISGSNNIFIGSHSGHAGGIGSILLGSTSYPSGSIFDSKFELGTQADSRIFHKDNGGAPLQIGYNTQVTGSLLVSNGLTVSGSIVATGSVKGNVSTLTIASNTASLDLSKGNFFTLQLVEGTDTRIEPTSIAAGQTVNIKLNTTGSATVSFPASVKQVSGSPYVPTTTTSVDVITLVSFDNTDLYLANVKNLV